MSGERKGHWVQTFTGRQFWPLDPRPEDVDIRDVAHHLALQCRFNGATREFYSVAQHSVLVSELVEERLSEAEHPPEVVRLGALTGLLHDGGEAYAADVVRPVKKMLGDAYAAIEDACQNVVEAELLTVSIDRQEASSVATVIELIPRLVIKADNVVLATEKRDLMAPEPAPWAPLPEPMVRKIYAWPPEVAAERFLEQYAALTGAFEPEQPRYEDGKRLFCEGIYHDKYAFPGPHVCVDGPHGDVVLSVEEAKAAILALQRFVVEAEEGEL